METSWFLQLIRRELHPLPPTERLRTRQARLAPPVTRMGGAAICLGTVTTVSSTAIAITTAAISSATVLTTTWTATSQATAAIRPVIALMTDSSAIGRATAAIRMAAVLTTAARDLTVTLTAAAATPTDSALTLAVETDVEALTAIPAANAATLAVSAFSSHPMQRLLAAQRRALVPPALLHQCLLRLQLARLPARPQ